MLANYIATKSNILINLKKIDMGKVYVKTVDKIKRGRVRVTVIEKVEEFKI